jgi:ubiquinone/menaquinone biosynthesis C-methylase UbiE
MLAVAARFRATTAREWTCGTTMTSAAFDKIATEYDILWTSTLTGRSQREAVWRRVDPFFFQGDRILDLGCGTGADAVHFKHLGVSVHGIDASEAMVRLAQAKGIEAEQLALEDLDQLSGKYDGAISNFGVLNCVERLDSVGASLARRIRVGGVLAICLMGPFCLWEACHFLRQGSLRSAGRRWTVASAPSSLGVQVRYPSVRKIKAALKGFKLLSWYGIGLFVPPSYVKNLSSSSIENLAEIDRHVAHWPALRILCDHRLLLFERL